MSELQLRAILAAIIYAGQDHFEGLPGYAAEAVKLADEILTETAKQMVSIQAENAKRQATGVQP